MITIQILSRITMQRVPATIINATESSSTAAFSFPAEQMTEQVTRYRRSSPGGQALHHWQRAGKLTTIHIVYELAKPLKTDDLVAAIDVKLLKRFPRFRGHVSEDERHWVVPEKVDARDYVEVVNIKATCDNDRCADSAVLRHVEAMMATDLPPRRSWQAQLLRLPGREQCFVLWRIAHTVADGVVLSQIMSNVQLQVSTPTPLGNLPCLVALLTQWSWDRGVPTQILCDPIDKVEPTQSDPIDKVEPTRSDPPPPPRLNQIRSAPKSAGALERLWRIACGILFCLALPWWPSDVLTALRLGPDRWARRKKASQTALTEAGGQPRIACALSAPIEVAELKAAAHAAGVSVNDLLMVRRACMYACIKDR